LPICVFSKGFGSLDSEGITANALQIGIFEVWSVSLAEGLQQYTIVVNKRK
jgi:hypothetical protein